MLRVVSRVKIHTPIRRHSEGNFIIHTPSARLSSSTPSRPLRTLSRVGATLFLGVGLSGSAYLFFWSNSEPSRPLSPFYWSSVIIESSEHSPTDPSTKIITLRIPQTLVPSNSPESITSYINPIHSIYVKDSDIQVERPYTPLFGIAPLRRAGGIHESEATTNGLSSTSSSTTLASSLPGNALAAADSSDENAYLASFWIKKYEHGEVGRWLHSKRPGDALEIRGPVVTLDFEKEIKKGNFDEVVMVRDLHHLTTSVSRSST